MGAGSAIEEGWLKGKEGVEACLVEAERREVLRDYLSRPEIFSQGAFSRGVFRR